MAEARYSFPYLSIGIKSDDNHLLSLLFAATGQKDMRRPSSALTSAANRNCQVLPQPIVHTWSSKADDARVSLPNKHNNISESLRSP